MSERTADAADGVARRSFDVFSSTPGSDGSESALTVAVALAANVLIAVAKTLAAVITGSASLLAEAAHSYADTGNEVLLTVRRAADTEPQTVTVKASARRW